MMDDLISRQAAIDRINGTGYADQIKENLILILRMLPSAQKTGQWIIDDEYIDCSNCRNEKWSKVPYQTLVKRFRYCPNCGAKMEVEHEPD